MTATAGSEADDRADVLLARLGLDAGMRRDFGGFLDVLDAAPAVPARVLTLCRLRVAALHAIAPRTADAASVDGAEAEALRRGVFDAFDPGERAALALVASLCFEPHAMTDAEVEACAEAFGPDGVVVLMTAIAFADADCRLRLTLPAARDPA